MLIVMAVLAVVVFIALFFVDAGYGMLLNRKWGKTVSNKVGWFVMESPVFLLMTVLWLMSDRRFEAAPLCFLFLFFGGTVCFPHIKWNVKLLSHSGRHGCVSVLNA